MLKNAILAAFLTIVLCILSIAGDAMFDTNLAWLRIEQVLNFPGTIALAMVGPGHGLAQLVVPWLFTLLFYFAAFWTLLVYTQRGTDQKGD